IERTRRARSVSPTIHSDSSYQVARFNGPRPSRLESRGGTGRSLFAPAPHRRPHAAPPPPVPEDPRKAQCILRLALGDHLGPRNARSRGTETSAPSSRNTRNRSSRTATSLATQEEGSYRYLTITAGRANRVRRPISMLRAHRSFIRSDFVTIPVTSPRVVTRTAL